MRTMPRELRMLRQAPRRVSARQTRVSAPRLGGRAMTEPMKTVAFLGVAAALGITAAVVQPESAAPAIFSDQGTAFYPKFTDPQAAKTIEVVDYDEATATATPLKVQFAKGHWTIVSHNDYPVEIGDRLAKTAASLMDLKRDIVRSESVQDYAQLGVIDPLDA